MIMFAKCNTFYVYKIWNIMRIGMIGILHIVIWNEIETCIKYLTIQIVIQKIYFTYLLYLIYILFILIKLFFDIGNY